MLDLLQPHQSSWKMEFESLKALLLEKLAGWDLDIQWVGSTAVPDLHAKPVLDVDIIIKDKSWLEGISVKLEQLGYISKGDQGIPDRYAFRQSTRYVPHTEDRKEWLTHHLYVCLEGSLALKNHLLFRDALLRDPALVARYSQVKIDLVNQPGMTREEYTKRKTEFILSVLATLGLDEAELDNIRKANE